MVLRNQKIVFWNSKESVKEVCLGIDENMRKFFKDGSIDAIVEESQPSDAIYSIQ